MEKIASFTVNHLNLKPGLYLSREDQVGDRGLKSYDLRFTAPNFEPVMNTAKFIRLSTWERLIYVMTQRLKMKSFISDRWDAGRAFT